MNAFFGEKILRVQPNVKRIYLLLRASDNESATQQFCHEVPHLVLFDYVIGQDLFNVLRKSWGANLESFIFERVTPIAGDISDENFGIKDSILREEMWNEIDIVLNSAATTNFDERYDIASGINTYGALHVLNFAKKCIKLKVLVHASTGQCRLELCPYTLISYFDCPVTPIAGDISDENFGIKDSILREEMWNEIDIVLNSAATTNFDERYDIASGINTYGALHVLNFAKKCIKLKVLVHASTGQCRLELCPYTLISYFDCP
ncbi:putative fatty acyl-coa reductase 4 [Quercus suber]|uniref:Fatty acyl-CoA reductase n=1 Tax=Quercus suber TaxID=58331 RepID=A0AAW0KD16_QUESU